MESTVTTIPWDLSSNGYKSTSSITGNTQIPSSYVIDDSNNQMSFIYNSKGTSYQIDLTLDNGTYNGVSAVTDELNTKLAEAFQNQGFFLPEVYATSSGQSISLKTAMSGSDYTFSGFTGSFYRDAMQKVSYTMWGYGTSGATYSNTAAYIVGRDTITDKTMVINPNINDKLTFDFYKNGTPTTFNLTLAPGAYDSTSLVSELNKQLQTQLAANGFSADTLSFQIGGVDSGTNIDDTGKLVIKYNTTEDGRDDNGQYIIDGVRGSAAYTCFYRAQGEPAPLQWELLT